MRGRSVYQPCKVAFRFGVSLSKGLPSRKLVTLAVAGVLTEAARITPLFGVARMEEG